MNKMDNSIIAKKEFLEKFCTGSIVIGNKKLKEIENESHFINIPEHLGNEMISLLPENKNSLIAVPYSVDLVFFLIASGYHNIVFFSDSCYKSKLIQSKEFCNISSENVILFSDHLDLIEKMKGFPMKFDAIIMNPPYGRLAPKILKGLVEEGVADEIVTIQPLYQFTTIKPQGDKNRTLKDGTDISKYISEIIIKDGQLVFKLNFTSPLAIFKLTLNKISKSIKVTTNDWMFINNETVIVNNLIDVICWGNSKMLTNIKNKIKNNLKNTLAYMTENNKDFRIPRGEIGMGINNIGAPNYRASRIFSIIAKSAAIQDMNGREIVEPIVFNKQASYSKFNKYYGTNSKTEAIHFRDYCFSNFVKMCHGLTVVDVHIDNIDLQHIPAFDFNTPVTNERIQNEFDLTDQEMEFIEDFGSQLNGEPVDWSKYD